MKAKSKAEQSRPIFFFSPLIFLAACVLLAVIIGVFAANNYQREKQLMELALQQEASAILNLVAAGTRNALRRGFMYKEFNAEELVETVAENIESSSEHPTLVALYLIDHKGVVRAHSDRARIGERFSEGTRTLLDKLKEQNQRRTSAIVADSSGEQKVFGMAMLYFPAAMMQSSPPSPRGRMGRGRPEMLGPAEPSDRFEMNSDNAYVFVAELSLEQYQQAVRKQILQLVILSLVLLLVGIGGLLSLSLLQTYRGSQTRLKEIRSLTDMLIASLPLGLLATGPDGRVRACNPSGVRMLDLKGKECIGAPIEDLLDRKVADWLKIHDEKKTHHEEMSFGSHGGGEKLLHFTKRQIEDDEQRPSGLMLLVQDLSQIRRLEDRLERAERDAVVGRMAAGVAHELRNPLSSIKGLVLLLKSRLDDDDHAEQTAELLIEQVERLNRSISELLDYARPAMLNRTKFTIDDLISKAVLLVRSDAESADISIVEKYRCGKSLIEGDQDKITQVILNICLNAIQSMDEGGTLEISTSCSEHEVVAKITDNGCGIAAEIREKVFEPYFTTKYDGTGLGLAMSAKIIADHNGSISIESSQNAGTSVVLRLPAGQ